MTFTDEIAAIAVGVLLADAVKVSAKRLSMRLWNRLRSGEPRWIVNLRLAPMLIGALSERRARDRGHVHTGPVRAGTTRLRSGR
jgi:hypothetical protein